METPKPGTNRQVNGRISRQRFSDIFPFIFILLLGISPFFLAGQPILRSVIRGTVIDKATQSPLVGATIVLLNSNPLSGTITDKNGNFKLPGVPIGQKQLKVTYVGYLPYITELLTVSSGKETIVVIPLQETVITSPEVEIKGDYRKYQAINRMATVGVRPFTVDETSRFAGSYNDPARMVENYAGVTSGIDNRNDIIIRGNSPMGLQWRIDGMEIPNPNHFAAVGTTGGPVTILNDNLMTNSDFFTGAYPASYGDALIRDL